jgi:hypothetical protein
MKKIQQSLVFELKLLLNFDVGLENLLPDVVDQDFDAGVDEALKLVNDHLLVRADRHVLTALILVKLRV